MKFLYILFFQIVSLSVMGQEYSKTLPVMFINTIDNAPITSKEEYVDAQYYVETFGSSKLNLLVLRKAHYHYRLDIGVIGL